jgi:hypothetical protein
MNLEFVHRMGETVRRKVLGRDLLFKMVKRGICAPFGVVGKGNLSYLRGTWYEERVCATYKKNCPGGGGGNLRTLGGI